ncbi:MAG TPA: PIN domain-containing protein [Stenotrophobium sp.]|nr:PIN domain-containing protein [Stenotrophobium sp.]
MKYLLDSNVILAAVKGRLPVVVRLSSIRPSDVAVSIIGRMEVEMELRASARAQGKAGRLMREFFESVRVLEFGVNEALQAATLGTYQRQSGERMDRYDLLVAATALAHQLILVTETPAAFIHVPGLETENWL